MKQNIWNRTLAYRPLHISAPQMAANVGQNFQNLQICEVLKILDYTVVGQPNANNGEKMLRLLGMEMNVPRKPRYSTLPQ